ncbi:ricin-type beta-trefoil lectin domain protein [Kitasatospora purpeofusca]|uniref:ricin-type beta-trefoil lectin domain protein n=1 Tax=Kitasatospora purpeofusca TaxID=67352 RepID=UPI0030F15049
MSDSPSPESPVPAAPLAPPSWSGSFRTLATALAALTVLPLCLLGAAVPAVAADGPLDPSRFKGLNWARPGDNFVDGPVVPEGLAVTDSYPTVKAKATAVYDGFRNTAGADTVRLPINTHSVPGTAWGDAYTGAVDAATAKGFKVILSYWEDGASSGGRIVDTAAFKAMWNAVTAKYGSNALVYFEPMNEPHGYTAAAWADVAATWITEHPSVPRSRILVSGSGYNSDVTPVCADSRLAGTYLSLHLYTFQSAPKTYAEWTDFLASRIGSCAGRTVMDEFGAPADDGRDYGDANSADNFVRYLRAFTDSIRSLGLGSVYWPALGGKAKVRPTYDWYSLYALHGSGTGSGTDLTLSVRNTTVVDRLKYAWGLGDGSPTSALRSVGTGTCVDVPGGTRDNRTRVRVAACAAVAGQRWTRTAGGELTVHGREKCLDALGRGSVDGTPVGIYDCTGRDNQKWVFHSDGTVRGLQSGLCLQANATTSEVRLRTCRGGTDQAWQVVPK